MFPGLGDLISCLSQIQSWCRVGSSWGGGRFKSQSLLYATQKAFTFWRATASLAALIKPRAPSHSQPVKIIKEALGHKAIIQFMLLRNYFVRNWVAWADPKLFGVAVNFSVMQDFPMFSETTELQSIPWSSAQLLPGVALDVLKPEL